MRWQVAPPSNGSAWRRALDHLPQADIFFTPEYHRVYESVGTGCAMAFIAEDGGELLFYPFLLRPIEAVADASLDLTYYDIETVRGQSGPLATSDNAEFLRRAWHAYSEWCRETRVVAEFTRFHLYLDNYRYAHPACNVKRHAESVALDLDRSEEALWDAYPSVQRNMVRKAIKHGLQCRELSLPEGLPAFKQLYRETMQRVGAAQSAFYSESFFAAMSSELGGQVRLWGAYERERIVAAALFLVSRGRIFYDLAGSDARNREAAPNNLLLHTVAQWGRAHGCSSLFLGDGSGNPSLMRFKASVSRERLPQYIGRVVHDKPSYEALNSLWMSRKQPAALPKITFPYRL